MFILTTQCYGLGKNLQVNIMPKEQEKINLFLPLSCIFLGSVNAFLNILTELNKPSDTKHRYLCLSNGTNNNSPKSASH
jgi:hypothetical protein